MTLLTTMNRHLIAATTLAVAVIAPAQGVAQEDLTHAIDLQHNVVVEHHDATRPAISPKLVLPALATKPLAFSERTISVPIAPAIAFLEPTAYADTIPTSPWPGYVAVGYFPVYNAAISAGYRLLDNDHSRLSASVQYDGSSYNIQSRPYETLKDKLTRHTVTAGLDYHLMVGKKSELDLGLDYTFARFNQPGNLDLDPVDGVPFDNLMWQSVNRVNGAAQWVSSVGGLQYSAGLAYGYFGYRHGSRPLAWTATMAAEDAPAAVALSTQPARDNTFGFNAAAGLPISDLSSIGLTVAGSIIYSNHHSWLSQIASPSLPAYRVVADPGSWTHGLVRVSPRYRLKADRVQLSIGARVEYTFHSGKAFHVAPEASIEWNPATLFTIWGGVCGGVHQNSLSSLYDVNYMMAPIFTYRDSRVPLVVNGGVRFGPLHGAYIEAFGGWATANDWLMPIGELATAEYTPSSFKAVNIKGWHAGVALGYKHRYFDFKAKGEMAPSSYDRGYYLWRDRARYVVSASVTARPIAGLTVDVDYSLRCRRSIIDRSFTIDALTGERFETESRFNLGNLSSLNLGGAYDFTRQFTVFLRLENLLNHRYTTLGLVEAQGFTGLAGVAYKF